MPANQQKWARRCLSFAILLGLSATTSAADYRPATTPAVAASCVRPSQWAAGPDTLAPRTSARAVAADGHIFALGGNLVFPEVTSWVESAAIGADGTLGAWITTTALSTDRQAFGAVAVNDYIYVMGGWGSYAPLTVDRAAVLADGQLGPWEPQTGLPYYREELVAVATSTHIYILGGQTGLMGNPPDESHDVLMTAIQADGSLGPWVSTSPLPIGRLGAGAAIAGSFIYVLGGDEQVGPGASHSVERASIQADGSLGAWQELAPTMHARTGTDALVADGYLYAIGGDGVSVTTVERAALRLDGSLGPWEEVDSLPAARLSFASASFNGHLYVIGGDHWDLNDGYSVTQTVEQVRAGDLLAPSANGLTINDGDLFTNEAAVSLSISGRAGMVQVQVSNDGSFAGVAWQDCVASLSWTISTYGVSTIPRVVYVKFKNQDESVSGTYSDDIILDVTPPSGTVRMTPMTAVANHPAAASDLPYKLYLPLAMRAFCPPATCPPNVMLHLSATDDASGVAAMQIGADPAFSSGQWEPYTTSKPWQLPAGQTSVYVRFRDNAGNLSATVTAPLEQ